MMGRMIRGGMVGRLVIGGGCLWSRVPETHADEAAQGLKGEAHLVFKVIKLVSHRLDVLAKGVQMQHRDDPLSATAVWHGRHIGCRSLCGGGVRFKGPSEPHPFHVTAYWLPRLSRWCG